VPRRSRPLVALATPGPARSSTSVASSESFFTWWYVGAVLGPLALPLAIDAVYREQRPAVTTESAASTQADGVAVLAGIDGSAASLAAIHAAVALLGDRVDRFTLAAVR
jgi:hypothetical protein